MTIAKRFTYLAGLLVASVVTGCTAQIVAEAQTPGMQSMTATGDTAAATQTADAVIQATLPTPNAIQLAMTGDAASRPAPTEQEPSTPPSVTPDLSLYPGFGASPTSGLPWWNDRVFYEVFVRSFYDSDGNGIGDLQGLIEKLDYLNDGDQATTDDLGITGIWLMPIMQSPGYHGYDVIDYYTVDSDYGTNDDFLRLMQAAHARNIAVIVDLPLNHTSDQSPWFEASAAGNPEYRDWYIWRDTNPLYTGAWGQTVWHPRNGAFYYAMFDSGMPDLNYSNPAVIEQMEDVTRYWLEKMGTDGFRVDAAKHLVEADTQQENTQENFDLLAGWNDYVDTVKPEAYTVGEIWSSTGIVARYTGDSVDMGFEFDLAQAMVQAARTGNSLPVRRALSMVLRSYPEGQFAPFLTNHDQNRVMSELSGEAGAAKVAASMLLTLPGVPFVYYGEEIGMVGQKPDERIRTPMQWDSSETGGFTRSQFPWEALAQGVEQTNVAVESIDPGSLLNHYRELIHLRNDQDALRVGETNLVDSAAIPVYAVLRTYKYEAVLVVVNLGTEEVSDYSLSLASGPLTDVSSVSVLMGKGEPVAPVVTADGGFNNYVPVSKLAAQSTLIILLD